MKCDSCLSSGIKIHFVKTKFIQSLVDPQNGWRMAVVFLLKVYVFKMHCIELYFTLFCRNISTIKYNLCKHRIGIGS